MDHVSTSVSENARSYSVSGNKAPDCGLLVGIRRPDERCNIFNVIFVSDQLNVDALVERVVAVQQMLAGNFAIIGLASFNGEGQNTIPTDILTGFGSGCRDRLGITSFTLWSLDFNDLIADRMDFDKSIGFIQRYDAESGRLENEKLGGPMWKHQSELMAKFVSIQLRLSMPWQIKSQEIWDADALEQEIRRHHEIRLWNLFMEKPYFLSLFSGQRLVSVMSLSSDNSCQSSGWSAPSDSTLLDLVGQLSGIKRKELSFHQDVLEYKLAEKITNPEGKGDADTTSMSRLIPVVQYQAGDFLQINVSQSFDIVAVCHQDEKLSNVPAVLVESFRRAVALRQKQLIKFSDLEKKKIRMAKLEPRLFLPPQCGHYVLAYYPVGHDDIQLESERREMHALLGLPTDRPLFRKWNTHKFPHQRGPYLIDVHEHVGDCGISATMTGVVHGHYQYRHYMQDNFDDKNWGCAYRSFQTIWSWFLLNGYTDKPVPNHKEIQQALVDVGDKQPNFVGSRLWVGSLELSFCLDQLAGITSKILNVNSGDEMGQMARELIHHFRTQGTPVMIGGGVLAHTILGVAYDEDSGEAKFLVLDPHYTGDENLKTILDKGWCGWKPLSFWDKNAFYNMMLPLRPNIF